MKFWLLFLLSLIFCSPFALVAQTEFENTLTHGGYERTYTVHVPASYDGTQPVPLVIALHGGGGSAENFAQTTRFDVAADERGFIVAYPDGVGNGWNDGRTAILQIAIRQRVDDVGFLSALIDTLSEQYNINRVYMAGISNGGMMTFRYACERADRLDGFMTVVASMPTPVIDACAPSQALPALMIFGDADPIMPFAGGQVGQGSRRGDYGLVASAEDTLTFWTQANGCAESLRDTTLPDVVDDGTRVQLIAFEECAGSVYFYLIENGGHGYPGDTSLRSGLRSNGIVTQDIDATELFIQYFGL